MQNKIIVLLVIFGVLALGVIIQQQKQRDPETLYEQMQAKALLPEEVATKNLQKFVIYRQEAQDEAPNKVVLQKKDDNWYIPSLEGSKADSDTVNDFIADIQSLYGEFRAEGEKLWEDFGLAATNDPLYIEVFVEAEQPAATLVVGKKIANNATFVRTKDSEKVYRVGKNLYYEVGLKHDKEKLSGNYWLEKHILDIDPQKLQKIVLDYPDKKLTFSLVEVEVPVTKKDKQEQQETETKKETKKEKQWQLVAGGKSLSLKKKSIQNFVNSLSGFQVDAVAESQDKAKYALEQPAFEAQLIFQDETKQRVYGSYPDTNELDCYLLLADEPIIYRLNRSNFIDLFKKGSDFFKLPSFDHKPEEITKLEWVTEEQHLVFARKENAQQESKKQQWQCLSHPEMVFTAKPLEEITKQLATLEVIDFAELEQSPIDDKRKLIFHLKDGTEHTLFPGHPSLTFQGNYIQFAKQQPVFAVSEYDHNKIFGSWKEVLPEKKGASLETSEEKETSSEQVETQEKTEK